MRMSWLAISILVVSSSSSSLITVAKSRVACSPWFRFTLACKATGELSDPAGLPMKYLPACVSAIAPSPGSVARSIKSNEPVSLVVVR